MPVRAIVSYDGTDTDHDAVALGRVYARAGAEVGLAYVRHATEPESTREEMAREQASRMLAAGAILLGNPEAERHVVLNASTPSGLAMLASLVEADVIIFGSDYRTPSGHVSPGTTAQRLLDSGATAIALAPAGMRAWADARLDALDRVGFDGDDDVRATAESLADAIEGQADGIGPTTELVVLGSRQDAQPGRLALGSGARKRIDGATVPVLALPRGVVLEFG